MGKFKLGDIIGADGMKLTKVLAELADGLYVMSEPGHLEHAGEVVNDAQLADMKFQVITELPSFDDIQEGEVVKLSEESYARVMWVKGDIVLLSESNGYNPLMKQLKQFAESMGEEDVVKEMDKHTSFDNSWNRVGRMFTKNEMAQMGYQIVRE